MGETARQGEGGGGGGGGGAPPFPPWKKKGEGGGGREGTTFPHMYKNMERGEKLLKGFDCVRDLYLFEMLSKRVLAFP